LKVSSSTLERLSYISKREEFVELLDYNSYKIDFYNQSLEYIEEKGVKTYGILVFGTAEEFLNSIDNIPYDTLHINNVLPTKPNIYR
ncbi:MAG: anti sigma factor C-terminal domain-containing protein, partial [Tissierellales bacterium]|nr:anti sigma factor C-terminal domain-containing protein [Tissierellales bacterium]